MDGLRVPPPATDLDPAEDWRQDWRRPTQAWVDQEVTSIAERLGATEEDARVFLNKLRNPKAVGNAPPKLVDTWVCALANAVASGKMDYGMRFAYGGFNLRSAFPLAAMNTWSIPSDCNMVTDPRPILDAARKPAVDSQFTLFSKLLCLTKELENVFVASVFHERDINLGDVDGVCPDGHISYDEFPGYKAADMTMYPAYFNGDAFPPEPENFGKFPPDASAGPTAYVLRSAAYPLFSVNGVGPNTRTLNLIKLLGGKYEKLSDQLARKLGSRYGLNGIEYVPDKEHYGMYFVFTPNQSEADGHLMLITLNPQFGSTAGGALGGGSAAHAELFNILKTQADVIRTLSDCDVLPMDRAHPLWGMAGDLGMRHVFLVASEMRAADERGERYATRHVRVGRENGRKYGFFGSEKTEEQREQDLAMVRENGRENGRKYGFFGSEKTEDQREQDLAMARENGRKHGFGGSDLTKEQEAAQNEANKRGGEACIRGMPKTKCPFCGASDVRLVWAVNPSSKTVLYQHKRHCTKGGKSGTKSGTCNIGDEEAWRNFLGPLDAEQFEAHKKVVMCEVESLASSLAS